MIQLSIISFVISIFFLGCSANQPAPQNNQDGFNEFQYDTTQYITKNNSQLINFDTLTKNLATENICENLKENSTLYVTDFVHQKDYTNHSQLGFILSNALKVNLLDPSCSKNVSIKTLNLKKYLSVSQNGTKILTNKLDEMKVTQLEDDKQIAIGTYTITSNQLILFLKLVELKDSNTIATSSTTTQITNEILEIEGIDPKQEEIYIQKPFHL